jgi:membrane fusion protein (multidrug efflux system)
MKTSAMPLPSSPGCDDETPGVDKAVSPSEAHPEQVGLARPSNKKRVLRRSIALLVLLSGGVFAGKLGYDYWVVGQYLVRTDDAYVRADFTAVAPKVSGYISEILVRDNEEVVAGQPLASIDDRDYRNALLQAKADLSAAEAAIANVDAQIELQRSLIAQAQATLNSSKASHAYAQSDAARAQRLTDKGAGTLARAEQSQSALDQAESAVNRDRAALLAANARLPVLQTQREQAIAQRERTKAAVAQAELNLSYTRILAPVSGTVGARSIRAGQFVTAGSQLMAVVPLEAVYVVANFKETQLTFMRPGQSVVITVDSFPEEIVEGQIDSISPGSGSVFSLLPSDNATGNFTKVVQRVPVKITLDNNLPVGHLRAGMSVVPEVDTREVPRYTARARSSGE